MFPHINYIEDFLPHVDQSKFSVTTKRASNGRQYTTIGYNVQYQGMFSNSYERECRGIKFDKDGKLIARPFHKFFNVGEQDAYSSSAPPLCAVEKIDGSMIHPMLLGDDILWCTKAGETDTSKQMQRELFGAGCKYEYLPDHPLLRRLLEIGGMPIFEYVSPKNRVVVEYDEPELYLIGFRWLTTGHYMTAGGYITEIAENLGVPLPNMFDIVGRDFADAARTEQGIEGYVLQWSCGNMVKVKTDEYVDLHRILAEFPSEKYLLGLVVSDKMNDLAARSGDFAQALLDFDAEIKACIAQHAEKIVRVVADNKESLQHRGQDVYNLKRMFADRVSYIMEEAGAVGESKAFFTAFDGGDVEEELRNYIGRNIGSSSRINERVRHIVGSSYEKLASKIGVDRPK